MIGADAAVATLEMGENPLGLLTFIAAPAILTNAASISAMATTNRLARGTDRVRALSAQLEAGRSQPREWYEKHLGLLDLADQRVLLMVRALNAFYFAVGAFSTAALISLVGAVLFAVGLPWLAYTVMSISLVAGGCGVGGLTYGSSLLVFETRVTFRALTEETEYVLNHHRQHLILDPRREPTHPNEEPPGSSRQTAIVKS